MTGLAGPGQGVTESVGSPHSSSFLYRWVVRYILRSNEVGPFDSYEGMRKERQKWAGTVKCSQLLQQLLYVLVDVEAAYLALNTSIFADIPWLLFVLIFSWTQTVWYWRFDGAPGPAGDDTHGGSSISFGQVVALFLLVIPVMAAAEALLQTADICPSRDRNGSSSADYKSNAMGQARVRLAMHCLAVWYTLVMAYAAVVTGSPFFDESWAASSALASVASLFAWQAYLELMDLSKKAVDTLRVSVTKLGGVSPGVEPTTQRTADSFALRGLDDRPNRA